VRSLIGFNRKESIMAYEVTGTAHINTEDILFSLKVEVKNLINASLTVPDGDYGVAAERRGQRLHAVVPRWFQPDPPADYMTEAQYEAFVAAIETGSGINLVLNIQSPLIVELVALGFKQEEGGRYAVSNI
jgi:hypothetical protein